MEEEKMIMFRNRLLKVWRHLGKQARRLKVNCYRLYDHDLPEFPFCIEFYGEKLYIAEYKRRHGMSSEAHDRWIEKCLEMISETLEVSKENIFLKLRRRKQGRQGQYQKLNNNQSEFVVEENALKFIINLSDYLDTGLFLDHRTTREMVKAAAKDKKVMNLFAYTGSFSVYAASGAAKEVVTVDLSKTYLQWAERNMQINGFIGGEKYKYVHADVMSWLAEVVAESFDIIIMDPPTFSNSKRMDGFMDIQKDHVKLINECIRILTPGGVLYFSTNCRQFHLDKVNIHSSSVKDITLQTTSFDFAGKLNRVCFLISAEG